MKRLLLLAVLLASVLGYATVTNTVFTLSYTCTGSAGPFAFTFPISTAAALTVTQNGTLLSSSQYTVVPVNNNFTNGGSVTLVAVCPSMCG